MFHVEAAEVILKDAAEWLQAGGDYSWWRVHIRSRSSHTIPSWRLRHTLCWGIRNLRWGYHPTGQATKVTHHRALIIAVDHVHIRIVD